MEDNINLKLLIEQKYKIFNKIEKLQKNFNKNSVANSDIFVQDALLRKYYAFFCDLNEKIENFILKHNNVDDSDKDFYATELAKKCELLYSEMKNDIFYARNQFLPEGRKISSVQQDNKVLEKTFADSLQLDIIQTFSGELFDWPDFRREYRALVHLNSSLTNPQKFDILKSLLSTEVFELIKNLFIYRKDIGYEDAWSLLEEKFSKRKNVEELLTTLLMQQPSVNGSSESIIQLLETTKKCLNGLISWNVDTKNWDMFLIHILVQKLNKGTKIEWENMSDECKTLFDFFNFLNSKIRKHSKSADDNMKTAQHPCICCNKKHPLWKCHKFESLGIDERICFVNGKTVCNRCLAPKHTISKCWKPFKCRICQSMEHHYLLHKNSGQRSKSCENLLN